MYKFYAPFSAGDVIVIANGKILGGIREYKYNIQKKTDGLLVLESLVSDDSSLPDNTVVIIILANELGDKIYQSFKIKSLVSVSGKVSICNHNMICTCTNCYRAVLLNPYTKIPDNIFNKAKKNGRLDHLQLYNDLLHQF